MKLALILEKHRAAVALTPHGRMTVSEITNLLDYAVQ